MLLLYIGSLLIHSFIIEGCSGSSKSTLISSSWSSNIPPFGGIKTKWKFSLKSSLWDRIKWLKGELKEECSIESSVCSWMFSLFSTKFYESIMFSMFGFYADAEQSAPFSEKDSYCWSLIMVILSAFCLLLMAFYFLWFLTRSYWSLNWEIRPNILRTFSLISSSLRVNPDFVGLIFAN